MRSCFEVFPDYSLKRKVVFKKKVNGSWNRLTRKQNLYGNQFLFNVNKIIFAYHID